MFQQNSQFTDIVERRGPLDKTVDARATQRGTRQKNLNPNECEAARHGQGSGTKGDNGRGGMDNSGYQRLRQDAKRLAAQPAAVGLSERAEV